ncbi:MAG: MBL fold metallo-hydrolase [Candidatus Kapabacteria bacterium]|nr:MBL fold metallo-hydrolase [Ignavibacteriota bacterium]MCW5884946.1 MBL fold metallo-hydrolase [Candidatus Kapabacteria bacterium]
MRISLLRSDPKVYSCFSYLVRGDWNAIPDINTLVDVGTDGSISVELNKISTGVGKRRVEQIIITHEHFDHVGGLKKIKEMYGNPPTYAFNKIQGIDYQVHDGMNIKIGDEFAEIIHTPGHSHDSICIYFPKSKILFSGDTVLFIKSRGGTYSDSYLGMLKRFYKMNLNAIYAGHDVPLTENINNLLSFSISNIENSEIIN